VSGGCRDWLRGFVVGRHLSGVGVSWWRVEDGLLGRKGAVW